MIKIYRTKEEAVRDAKTMKGWKINIIKEDNGGYMIRANKTRYYRVDGFFR